MSLSYLDLLLGTTMVFVVLFGLSARQDTLPEEEGNSLSLVIAVPTGGRVQRTVVRLEYRPPKGEKSYVLQRSNPADPQHDREQGNQRELVFSGLDFQRDGLIYVRGQPDREGTLTVDVWVTIPRDELHESLLDAKPNPPRLDADDKKLLGWVEEGTRLALDLDVRPETQRRVRIEDWIRSCPRYPDKPLAQRLAFPPSRNEGQAALATENLVVFGRIVHDALIVEGEKLTPVKKPREEEEFWAYVRVRRHLECRWGRDNPLTNTLPPWCRANKTGQYTLEDLRNPDRLRVFLCHSPDLGPSCLSDRFAQDVAEPLRVYVAYSGRNGLELGDWDDRKVVQDGLQLHAHWSRQF